MAWFNYNGGSPVDPNSFSSAGTTPSCQEGTTLCALNATNSGGRPSITPALISEMLVAVVLQQSSANVKLKD